MKKITKILISEGFSEDHVYYDNMCNVKIIHTYFGCPFAFQFENIDDWELVLKKFYVYFREQENKITVSEIFKSLGLIIDDYPGFEKYFTCWTGEDFYKENIKYGSYYLSFGTMEAPKEEA